jgi:hypothetical protein
VCLDVSPILLVSVDILCEVSVAILFILVSGAGVILLDVSVIVVESVVVLSDPLLLQAAIAPATARIARIFFIVLGFDI